MRGKKAKEIRRMVYMGGKPIKSFVNDEGTLQVDVLRQIYQRTKKYYKEGTPGKLPELLRDRRKENDK